VRTVLGPNDYNNIIRKELQSANSFVWKLTGQQVPQLYEPIADVRACCACLIPKQMLENTPLVI
jgi:hypothetical protein